MGLSAASRIHSNTGTDGTAASTVGTVTPALAGADQTSDDASVLAFHATASLIDNPGDWVIDASAAAQLYAFRRPAVAAGESSWPFTLSSAGFSVWRAAEWAGLDLVDPLAASAVGSTTAGGTATCSTGTTGTSGADDTVALAVFSIHRASAGQGLWPAGRSYSGGFTEVSFHANGTGNGAADRALAVAELYPGAAGTFECSITLDASGGGSLATISMQGLIVVYRAAQPRPDPLPLLTSAPPP